MTEESGSIRRRIKRLFSPAPQGPTQPYIQWIPGAHSLRAKRPGSEAQHSIPCNAEVKNGGAIRPLPHTYSRHGN
jgi:hypothetical protein